MVECKLVLTRANSTTTTGAAVYSWTAGGHARSKLNAHCTGTSSGTQTLHLSGQSVQTSNSRGGDFINMLYGPLQTCPKCGQPESFIERYLRRRGLTFKCNKCRHTELKELPPITKQIIYIDQFALSKMVKNKDDPFWAELHERLTRLKTNEVITCPYSPIHIEFNCAAGCVEGDVSADCRR